MDLKSLPDMLASLGIWYRMNHRPLPFRKKVHWYTTLVSEVMLQQTRIAAMLPAYQRFLQQFPDVKALANAAEEDVLHAWAGLGYYRRARNLQKAAKQIVERHGGRFPIDRKEALSLAGIGPYTAAAVRSIALGLPDPVVDGNVLRVLSRWFYDTRAASKNSGKSENSGEKAIEAQESSQSYGRNGEGRMQQSGVDGVDGVDEAESSQIMIRENAPEHAVQKAARALMEHSPLDPSTHNQSLMELGAMICTPGLPSCAACPVKSHCSAFLTGGPALASDIPPLKKIKRQDLDLTLYWIENEKGVILIRNPERPILRHDWLLPCKIESASRPVYSDELSEALPGQKGSKQKGEMVAAGGLEGGEPFSHSIMNYRIRCRVRRVEAAHPFSMDGQDVTPLEGKSRKDSSKKAECIRVARRDISRYCPSSLIKKAVQRIDGDF